MRTLLALLLFAASACSQTRPTSAASPLAQDQEVALEIVWEGVYGMTVAQRPTITWLAPDDTSDEYSTLGHLDIVWTGSTISATHFSAWLEGDREWLVFPPGELDSSANAARLTQAAQNALGAAGL